MVTYPLTPIFDAAGDLVVGTGADTAVKLPIGANGLVLKSNGTTAVWDAIAGTGDVVGDASSVDNAITRFDGTTGKAIQNSGASIDDTGNLTANNFTGTSSGSNTGDQDLSTYQVKPSEGAFVDGDKTKLDGIATGAEVNDPTTLVDADIGVNVQAHSAVLDATTASFLTTDETKLDGIEASADVTDTINVTAAGALMDSEVTNLAQVKAFDTTDYAAASHTHVASTDIVATGTPSVTTYLRGDDTWATVTGGSGDVATDTIWDAKGDLAGGTGADTASSLTVGTDGQVLTADSAEVTGMKWATASGSGDVTKVGTPLNNQVGVWTGDGTLEGDTALTFDGSTLGVTGDITVTGTVDGIDVAARDHNEVSIAASGGRDYVTISGTQQLTLNTVDLTADVSGLLPTGNIADDAVTYAKVQNVVANNVILGNNAGAGSIVDELTATEVRAIINVEDGADVTDTANVTAAGALMDSEVDADIKTLSLPARHNYQHVRSITS